MEDEDRLRADLLTGFHILDEEGQNSGIAGHLTARLPKGRGLLGHRYGGAFDEVRAEDILAANVDLGTGSDDRVSPSLAFHVSIYQARPEVGTVNYVSPYFTVLPGCLYQIAVG